MSERGISCDSCDSPLGWEGMGRGVVGGGGPRSFSMGRSGLSSGLRGGIRNGDGGRRGVGVDVSAGTVDSEAGWIGGAGRGASGGGAGTFTGSRPALSSGAPSSTTSSFSSDFWSSSEDNTMDYDQLDIPTHEKYKVVA